MARGSKKNFLQTIKMGRTFAKAWSEKKGRSGVDSQANKALSMWYMNMQESLWDERAR